MSRMVKKPERFAENINKSIEHGVEK